MRESSDVTPILADSISHSAAMRRAASRLRLPLLKETSLLPVLKKVCSDARSFRDFAQAPSSNDPRHDSPHRPFRRVEIVKLIASSSRDSHRSGKPRGERKSSEKRNTPEENVHSVTVVGARRRRASHVSSARDGAGDGWCHRGRGKSREKRPQEMYNLIPKSVEKKRIAVSLVRRCDGAVMERLLGGEARA